MSDESSACWYCNDSNEITEKMYEKMEIRRDCDYEEKN